MKLIIGLCDVTDEGLLTARRKNDALPKMYRWDKAGQLRGAIDNILAYKRFQKMRSIYLFCNEEMGVRWA